MRAFRLAAAAALLVALLPASPRAQSLHGAANTTCSQYLRAARMSDILYHEASNWLLGYVSGMNAALRASGGAGVISLTNDQLLKSAGDFCEANPARTLAEAANAWYPTIPRQIVTQEPAPRNYDHLKKPFARPLERK